MWVLIDNYDSFTYILHHYLLQTGNECRVIRNDACTIDELAAMDPSRIIISPGPETPLQAGITMDAVRYFHDKLPVLGVCLGHQALGMFFGAQLIHVPPMHGKVSDIRHNGDGLFYGLPETFPVMRYHSLAITGLAGTGLRQTAAEPATGICMAVRHEWFPCVGVQFHPESVGTPQGLQLLQNWAGMRFS